MNRPALSNPLLICRSTQQSFLRLLTTNAIVKPYGVQPATNSGAWAIFERLAADSRVQWVDEPAGLTAEWKKLTDRNSSSPKLWMDAYLAAFAIVGGHQLVTTDKAFKQFKGLDLHLLENA